MTDDSTGAFAVELQVRLAEARTQLAAAEALGDPLAAQMAEGDVRELEAMAARNDVPLDLPLDVPVDVPVDVAAEAG